MNRICNEKNFTNDLRNTYTQKTKFVQNIYDNCTTSQSVHILTGWMVWWRGWQAGGLQGSHIPNLSRARARALTLQERFQIVAQSLLLYGHWYNLPERLPHL
jgi:hypothetical protein